MIVRQIKTKNEFQPSKISILYNPLYIIRSDLARSICEVAKMATGKILDFGCGSKPYEDLFVGAESYVGVDIASSGHCHESSKVDIYYDGKKLPFMDEEFDVVVSFEVFEHVFNLQDVLQEINRVLKKDGLLIFTTPFAWVEHEIPYDFARYSSFAVKYLLEQAGFNVKMIKKTNHYFLALCQLFQLYIYECLPKNKYLRILPRLIIVPIINILSLLINVIVPKREGFYSNIIVVADKLKTK